MGGPTLAGYLEFLRDVVGITVANLPDNSPFIEASYDIALQTVNTSLATLVLPKSSKALPTMYALAVYNLATDRLINFAPDQPNADPMPGSNPPQKFFAYARKEYNVYGFVSGAVQSTNDNGTGGSFVVPEQLNQLTLADLQNLKTPWGRAYLGIAQSYGPSIWGVT